MGCPVVPVVPIAEAGTFSVVLELRPSRDGEGPVINRLRKCLKALGRAYGFRCVSIGPEQMKATAEATPEALNANPNPEVHCDQQ